MSLEARSVGIRRRVRNNIGTLIVIILLLLSMRIVLQNFHIRGHSMEPTLHDQEYVFVNKAAYILQAPERGDIIVFKAPPHPREDYIKRIIAVPGDIISVVGETVTVNGVTLREVYVNKDDPYNNYPAFKNRIIGPDQYFVMGDNRGDSADSRQWGLVPRDNIIGKAFVVYWPFTVDNFGFLPSENSVFAQIR